MKMGQVWSKANFDGVNAAGHQGGRGSVLAVTSQNPGPDLVYGTSDDITTPLNAIPIPVSIDQNVGNACTDPRDRVRGFHSLHPGGSNFALGDGSVRFIAETIEQRTYRAFSTIADGDSTSH